LTIFLQTKWPIRRSKLFRQRLNLRDSVKKAAESGERIPKQSNVYEEIVRKGWEVVKKERKK